MHVWHFAIFDDVGGEDVDDEDDDEDKCLNMECFTAHLNIL